MKPPSDSEISCEKKTKCVPQESDDLAAIWQFSLTNGHRNDLGVWVFHDLRTLWLRKTSESKLVTNPSWPGISNRADPQLHSHKLLYCMSSLVEESKCQRKFEWNNCFVLIAPKILYSYDYMIIYCVYTVFAIQCGSHKRYWKTHPENFCHYKNIEYNLHFDGIKFPANNDTDKFEELNQNVSVNMFEVDDENGQTVISRKLKKRCWMPYWCVKDWWGW